MLVIKKVFTPLLVLQRLSGFGVLLISWSVLQLLLASLLLFPVPARVREIPLSITHLWCKAALWWFNVRLVHHNKNDAFGDVDSAQPVFLAANHVSWLDPLLMFSCIPSRFVTSRDIAAHPFLGFITKLGGCFFMSRNAAALRSELKEIRESGVKSLAFYPEATSGDGAALLPFKSALFEISVRGNIPVIPLTINYRKVDNIPINTLNRDKICYYGDMYFAPHFFGFLTLWSLDVELFWNNPVITEPEWDRKVLSQKVYQKISTSFSPILPCGSENPGQNCQGSEVGA